MLLPTFVMLVLLVAQTVIFAELAASVESPEVPANVVMSDEIPPSVEILFVGEIFPKTFIRRYANYGIVALSPFLTFFKICFFPLLAALKILGIMNVSKSIILISFTANFLVNE